MIYAHEHLHIDLSGVKKDDDCCLNDKSALYEELCTLKAKGVRAVVDVTCRGMGRNTEFVSKIAQETSIQVLYATGWYKEPFLPEEVYSLSEVELAQIMVTEIEQGIRGKNGEINVKATVIGETGTSLEIITPIEKKILRAAARVHECTGRPLVTHTTLGRLGLEQLAVMREFFTDFGHVVISHVDLANDADYVLRLADKGVNVAVDTIGKVNYATDASRVDLIKALCDRGYGGQIVLSMDITRRSHLRKSGGKGYSYLLETFLPLLKNAEISDSDLKSMMVDNPMRIYGIG